MALIRIPSLPIGPMTDAEGNATDGELTYRQALNNNLQGLFGNEGVVVPTLTATEISTIEAKSTGTGVNILYHTQYGTIVYNSTANSIMIAVSDGLVPAKPIFKTVTLT
jgi:hypothetical protein